MTTAFISHTDCQLHNMGMDHPESPNRLAAILNQLQGTGIEQELMFVRADEAERKHLLRVHPEIYLQQLDMMQPPKGRIFCTPDTVIMKDTLRAARLSAGAAVAGVDLVMTGQAQNAFCSTRPPGHHAERSKTMGFCFYNNVAVAARHALDFHGLERIAIIDFDVHQGNGTVDAFAHDPRVLVCSSFEYPHYPYSHHIAPSDNVINTPLDAGTGSRVWRNRVERDWLSPLQRHKPQLVLVSAGFDAHRLDTQADIDLENADFRWITTMLADVARGSASSRLVSVLEGGYHLTALAESVEQHLIGLLEAK